MELCGLFCVWMNGDVGYDVVDGVGCVWVVGCEFEV